MQCRIALPRKDHFQRLQLTFFYFHHCFCPRCCCGHQYHYHRFAFDRFCWFASSLITRDRWRHLRHSKDLEIVPENGQSSSKWTVDKGMFMTLLPNVVGQS